jgi:L-2-amino-thiazoline-4-carboxylic acid hydrolase-like protein
MTDDIQISHFQRRKIEGRVLIPFIAACREKLGDGPTREVVAAAISSMAVGDGERWAETFGADLAGLRRVAEEVWAGGGGMELEVVEQTADRLAFNVTRCRYAEFYRELGLADVGVQVHCARDHAMVEGFSHGLELERSQTLLAGGSCCDFRFRKKKP